MQQEDLTSTEAMFPATAEELARFGERIATSRQEAANEVERISKELRGIENRKKWLDAIAEIIEGLRTSWKLSDPGKYRMGYYFLSPGAHERVVAREFLPPDTKVYTREEWEERTKGYTDFRFSGYDGVPPRYKVVPLAEVAQEECPLCGGHHPLIESYLQTEDSPSGDTWSMTTLVICPRDLEYAIINTQTSGYRFR